tara:strand:+ start:8770 stop:10341 length:1572 start_codon:yes stop_codon:yes gene_type:complete
MRIKPHIQYTNGVALDMAKLESLTWSSRFIDETPGDKEVGGKPRQVPGACWSKVQPTEPVNPKLRLWSAEMAEILNLTKTDGGVLGGGKVVKGMQPYAQRYGGHQFGNWAHQLGDGRAITLGEVKTPTETLELQLKGAGRTPYSRFADGRAVLRSSIREFLCSEAMFHLNVPTTRALSLVTTGDTVVRDVMYDGNPAPEIGAVVCRVAPSFIRFGSFQIHTADGNHDILRTLLQHTIKHHFPQHSVNDDEGILHWLKHVAETTAEMISHWMRVGFVHGVMNTDNMSIHGLTIDYGPYGWLEDYDPNWTPNTTDASTKRYRYGQQAQIGAWNIARLAEAIAPLINDVESLYSVLEHYENKYIEFQNTNWGEKLGIKNFQESDEALVIELNELLQQVETDMTIFFRVLCHVDKPDAELISQAFYDPETIPMTEWNDWLSKWWQRVDGKPDRSTMLRANPKYVLRNWMAQLAIDAAEQEDYSICHELHNLLKQPYDEQPEMEEKWFQKRPEWARHRVGCSMLSCSS